MKFLKSINLAMIPFCFLGALWHLHQGDGRIFIANSLLTLLFTFNAEAMHGSN
jgi:hypothetical protein